MAKLITPPTGSYLLPPHVTDLHTETLEWLSDLEFCKTELTFLIKLLNKIFLRLNTTQKRNDSEKLEVKALAFQSISLKKLHEEIIRHEQHLASQDKDRFSLEEKFIRNGHEKINNEIKEFTGNVKKLKTEIFDFVERNLKQNR